MAEQNEIKETEVENAKQEFERIPLGPETQQIIIVGLN